ncbi:hypothetical protein EXW45_05690 [Bacillus wiedmannii]|nr:hypothetical protein EXW45_05690 [Bacillus wiedmannii]
MILALLVFCSLVNFLPLLICNFLQIGLKCLLFLLYLLLLSLLLFLFHLALQRLRLLMLFDCLYPLL